MGALVSSPRRPAASRRTPAPPGCRVIRTFPKDSLDRAAAQVGDVGSIKVIFFRSTSCSSSVGIVSSSVGILISSSSRAFPGSGIRSRHFRMIRLPSPTTSEPTPAERRDGVPGPVEARLQFAARISRLDVDLVTVGVHPPDSRAGTHVSPRGEAQYPRRRHSLWALPGLRGLGMARAAFSGVGLCLESLPAAGARP